MFYAQSIVKGHIRAKQKCIPTTSKNYDSLLNTQATVEDWINLGEMENEFELISQTAEHKTEQIPSCNFD